MGKGEERGRKGGVRGDGIYTSRRIFITWLDRVLKMGRRKGEPGGEGESRELPEPVLPHGT